MARTTRKTTNVARKQCYGTERNGTVSVVLYSTQARYCSLLINQSINQSDVFLATNGNEGVDFPAVLDDEDLDTPKPKKAPLEQVHEDMAKQYYQEHVPMVMTIPQVY